MSKRVFAGVVAAVLVLSLAGCKGVQKPTTVQKGGMIGGGVGGVAGAIAGTASSLGGARGGLIGIGLGAATGAIAADTYYEDDDGDDLSQARAHADEVEHLSSKLHANEAQLAEMRDALEEERAQRQALLEAYEKDRSKRKELNAKFGKDIIVTGEDGGIKLTILSEVLFSSGKCKLTAEGQAVLAQVAKTIRKEFPEWVVEVRGHTDNVPIRYSKYASNWELSCARSLSVLHFLVESHGFKPEQMMVTGCADTVPLASNDTPDGRRMNRRAEIILRPEPMQVAAQ